MRSLKALVTGATAPGFVSIVKALKSSKKYNFEIIGSDYRKEMSSDLFSEKCFVLPDNRSDEFPIALAELCKEESVDVVLPIRTDDQMPICKNLELFREIDTEPAIVVTDPDLLDIILNKRKLMEYCKDIIQIETPAFSYAKDAEALRSQVFSLGYPENPVVIKPSYSNGSRGLRILNEQIDWKSMFYEEKPTGIYSTLDRVLNDIGESFPELVIMEYLPGNEYTLDVLCRKGIAFAVVPRLREGMTGGITTRGIISNDENYEHLSKTAEAIVEGLGMSYNAGMQLKESKGGRPLLLEINPRLQGTTTISVAAGVNIPEMMVEMAMQEFDYDYSPDIRWGLEMERIWLELFRYNEEIWRNDG